MIVQFIDCTFYKNTALDHVVALNIINEDHVGQHFSVYDPIINIELFDCKFEYNLGGKSMIYISTPLITVKGFTYTKISLILSNSTFGNSKGTALYLIIPEFHFKGNNLFCL